jgi:hypothetical protein
MSEGKVNIYLIASLHNAMELTVLGDKLSFSCFLGLNSDIALKIYNISLGKPRKFV